MFNLLCLHQHIRLRWNAPQAHSDVQALVRSIGRSNNLERGQTSVLLLDEQVKRGGFQSLSARMIWALQTGTTGVENRNYWHTEN